MDELIDPSNTPPDSVAEHKSTRRDFLRAAMAMTGGAALGARAEDIPMPAMDHSMHMGHGGGYDTMMFMPGHIMAPGAVIEPPGAPADNEVEYKVFDIDVSISMRVDKRLYGDGVAGAVLGFREDEDRVHFGDHYVFLWNHDLELRLGHAPLRNRIIEFPTLRDDDLLSATHVGNASSNANFDQTHGDVASVDGFIDGVHALGLWAGSRVDEPALAVTGLDTGGVSYVYAPPETLRYVNRVRHAGVLVDAQKVRSGSNEMWMNAVVAGIDVNLNANPAANWSLQTQLIAVAGTGAPNLATVASRACAKRIAGRRRALHRTARAAYALAGGVDVGIYRLFRRRQRGAMERHAQFRVSIGRGRRRARAIPAHRLRFGIGRWRRSHGANRLGVQSRRALQRHHRRACFHSQP